jgi:hypothetical protein
MDICRNVNNPKNSQEREMGGMKNRKWIEWRSKDMKKHTYICIYTYIHREILDRERETKREGGT